VAIHVPPLRECREDIPVLIDEFVRQFSKENDRNVTGMSAAAMDLLTAHPWPGNVRELKNCVEGMLVMSAADGLLDVPDIPNPVRQLGDKASGPQTNSGLTMREIEKMAIADALAAAGYNRREAAATLDIGLSTLYRKEKEYGLGGGRDGRNRVGGRLLERS